MKAPLWVRVDGTGVCALGCHGWQWWNWVSRPVFGPVHVGSWGRGLPESTFLCCAELPTAWRTSDLAENVQGCSLCGHLVLTPCRGCGFLEWCGQCWCAPGCGLMRHCPALSSVTVLSPWLFLGPLCLACSPTGDGAGKGLLCAIADQSVPAWLPGFADSVHTPRLLSRVHSRGRGSWEYHLLGLLPRPRCLSWSPLLNQQLDAFSCVPGSHLSRDKCHWWLCLAWSGDCLLRLDSQGLCWHQMGLLCDEQERDCSGSRGRCVLRLWLPWTQWGPCKRPSQTSPPWLQDTSRPGREPS